MKIFERFFERFFKPKNDVPKYLSGKNKKKFDPKVRGDGEEMTDKEKMDKGFNGKTYTINSIEYDF